jgi:hypothetical protein
MVVAHHVADDLRALAVLRIRGQVLLPHRVEDAALNRLQPVPDVGQCARRNDRQRVIEVAGLRRFVQRDPFRLDRPAGAACIDNRSAAFVEQRWFFLSALRHVEILRLELGSS